MYELSGVGSILINRKPIEYSATAQSVVSLYCFPIGEVKELVSKKYRLEELLQVNLFMLEIRL